jgi:hypothetical protein
MTLASVGDSLTYMARNDRDGFKNLLSHLDRLLQLAVQELAQVAEVNPRRMAYSQALLNQSISSPAQSSATDDEDKRGHSPRAAQANDNTKRQLDRGPRRAAADRTATHL